MGEGTRKRRVCGAVGEAVPLRDATGVAPIDVDPLTERIRSMVRQCLEQVMAEEVASVLQAQRYERLAADVPTSRRGYRHAHRGRTIATSVGAMTVQMPRARLFTAPGATAEWHSRCLPRYARRMTSVDDTIVQTYLAGANTRRLRSALQPLLKGAPLSKSAVSRVVQVLKRRFDAWASRPLTDLRLVYLFLDAIHVKVRVHRRVASVPVLVALGVDEQGGRELVTVRLMGQESTAAWEAVIEDLVARGVPAPVLCIIDGHAGLRRAVAAAWPRAAIQRCVVHKLRNVLAHAPEAARDELRGDVHAITEAPSLRAAQAAHARFVETWRGRCPGAVKSLLEAGDDLLTVFRFPASQWRGLRTTNAIERLQQEFRRRIKTQTSLPTEAAVVSLFVALCESGQIHLRRLNGWSDMALVLAQHAPERLRTVA
jgi:putative transposase